MKIKQIKHKNQKILELQLIKLRTYEQYDEKIKNTLNNNIYQTLINIKKALKIIFKYNTRNKKILFLGFAGPIVKKINKQTNHVAIPLNIKLQGLISNHFQLKNKIKYSLPKLRKKPKLIIIFDKIENYELILNESYKAKIPTITFESTFNKKIKNTNLYNILVNIDFLQQNKLFFYNCLNFLFKKKAIYKRNEKKKI